MQQLTGQLGECDGVLVCGEHGRGAEGTGEGLGAVDRSEQPRCTARADDLHEVHGAVIATSADHRAFAGAVGDDDGTGVRGEHPGQARQSRIGAGLEHGDLAGGGIEAGRAQGTGVVARAVVRELKRQAMTVLGPGTLHREQAPPVRDLGRDQRPVQGLRGGVRWVRQGEALGSVQHHLRQRQALLDRRQPVLAVPSHGIQGGREQGPRGPGRKLLRSGQRTPLCVAVEEGAGLLLDPGQQAGGEPGAEIGADRAESGTVQVHHTQGQATFSGHRGRVHGDQHLIGREVAVDHRARCVGRDQVSQPGGELVDPLGAVGQQVGDGLGGHRDEAADARRGQVTTGDVGRMQTGDDAAEPSRRRHGQRVGGEAGEVSIAPALTDEHRPAAPPAALVEGGHAQLAPVGDDLQQNVQRAGGHAQHLIGARQQQHRVSAGVVAQHSRGRATLVASQHPMDLAAEAGIALEPAAEQIRGTYADGGCGARMLTQRAPGAVRAAQDVLAFVA